VTGRICALVSDLMDRSKMSAAVGDVAFVRAAGACAHADVVVIDLAKFGDQVAAVRAAAPHARIVTFGPHVDDVAADAAAAAGADAVLPRSKFFRDIPAAMSA
jgi:hypothetical protein